ncbi:MAG: hypothetical protein ABR999_08345 [Methanoregula sp.]
MLCYHELGMNGTGGITGFQIREEIGILLLELQRDFSLTDIEREVAFLDEALRNIRKSERAERTVTPEQDTSGKATGPSGILWQQYPYSRLQKERAGLR